MMPRPSSFKTPAALLLCMLLIHAKADEHALPLPSWSEQELRTFRESLPGLQTPGGVLPKNGESISDINDLINTPLASGPRLDHFFDNHENAISPRLQVEDIRRFLPEAILGMPTQSQTSPVQMPTPISALKEVSPEFLTACAQNLPGEYLIDPDQLMPEIQNYDMMRLLGFHAQDARVKLYVLVTGHDQKLPESADLGKIASGSLLQSDSCLLVYPLGEPWRTRLFVSRSIHNQVSTEFLSETIQACLKESLQTTDAHDQLHRYAIHLSTRLFWLQKALGTDAAGKVRALDEFSPAVKAPATSGLTRFMPFMIWGSSGVLLLGLVGVGGSRLLHHLRLKRRRCVWMLSEPETIPRLGGAFTGGGGAMIRYS